MFIFAKAKSLAVASLFALATASVHANSVSTTVNILDTDPGSVQYVNFSVTTAGNFNISAEGSDTLTAAYNNDPQIHLFANSLTLGNLLASDDDSGDGFNSLISSLALGIGNYILAVSEFELTPAEAISGINVLSIADPGLIFVTISSQDGSASLASSSIPEPGSLALLGLGIAGLGMTARRRRK